MKITYATEQNYTSLVIYSTICIPVHNALLCNILFFWVRLGDLSSSKLVRQIDNKKIRIEIQRLYHHCGEQSRTWYDIWYIFFLSMSFFTTDVSAGHVCSSFSCHVLGYSAVLWRHLTTHPGYQTRKLKQTVYTFYYPHVCITNFLWHERKRIIIFFLNHHVRPCNEKGKKEKIFVYL